MAIHLRDQPEHMGRAARALLDLAPSGVYLAAVSPRTLVSSYLTVSPLPVPGEPGHRRSVLCCAIRRGKRLAQVLPGNVPYGARTFLECLHTRDHPADSTHEQDIPGDR